MPDLLFSLPVILICMLPVAGTAYQDLDFIFFPLCSVAFLNRGDFFSVFQFAYLEAGAVT